MSADVNRAEVAFRIKKIVAEQLGLPKDELENDASFVDDLGADSLEVMQIMMLIEDEFWMTFPDKPEEDISTVGHAIDFVFSATERRENGPAFM